MVNDNDVTPKGYGHPLPECERCQGRLRWLGAPHHPDNPSSWVCDPCEREAFVVAHVARKNGLTVPGWAEPLEALYDLHHGVSEWVEAKIKEAWRDPATA